MSTSDKVQEEAAWQLWNPDSLFNDIAPLAADAPKPVVDRQPSEQLQAEIVHIRQQAEYQGYAQGERRGIEEGKAKGYEEGFVQGQKEGAEQGAIEVKAQQQDVVERLARLVQEFEVSLDSLDSVIPSRLVQLALTAVRSMLGSQIYCDSKVLLEIIQRLLQENFQFKNHTQLWVSDEDLPIVGEHMGDVLATHGWELCADARILPGGCRITADEGELDATLSTRWQALCNLSREDHLS